MIKFPSNIKKINKELILDDISTSNIIQTVTGTIQVKFNPYEEMIKELNRVNKYNSIEDITNGFSKILNKFSKYFPDKDKENNINSIISNYSPTIIKSNSFRYIFKCINNDYNLLVCPINKNVGHGLFALSELKVGTKLPNIVGSDLSCFSNTNDYDRLISLNSIHAYGEIFDSCYASIIGSQYYNNSLKRKGILPELFKSNSKYLQYEKLIYTSKTNSLLNVIISNSIGMINDRKFFEFLFDSEFANKLLTDNDFVSNVSRCILKFTSAICPKKLRIYINNISRFINTYQKNNDNLMDIGENNSVFVEENGSIYPIVTKNININEQILVRYNDDSNWNSKKSFEESNFIKSFEDKTYDSPNDLAQGLIAIMIAWRSSIINLRIEKTLESTLKIMKISFQSILNEKVSEFMNKTWISFIKMIKYYVTNYSEIKTKFMKIISNDKDINKKLLEYLSMLGLYNNFKWRKIKCVLPDNFIPINCNESDPRINDNFLLGYVEYNPIDDEDYSKIITMKGILNKSNFSTSFNYESLAENKNIFLKLVEKTESKLKISVGYYNQSSCDLNILCEFEKNIGNKVLYYGFSKDIFDKYYEVFCEIDKDNLEIIMIENPNCRDKFNIFNNTFTNINTNSTNKNNKLNNPNAKLYVDTNIKSSNSRVGNNNLLNNNSSSVIINNLITSPSNTPSPSSNLTKRKISDISNSNSSSNFSNSYERNNYNPNKKLNQVSTFLNKKVYTKNDFLVTSRTLPLYNKEYPNIRPRVNWLRRISRTHGKIYYCHEPTGMTFWQHDNDELGKNYWITLRIDDKVRGNYPSNKVYVNINSRYYHREYIKGYHKNKYICPYGIGCKKGFTCDLPHSKSEIDYWNRSINKELNSKNKKSNSKNNNLRGTVDCKHWVNGFCCKGNDCDFKHDKSINFNTLCPHYPKCDRMKVCMYNHKTNNLKSDNLSYPNNIPVNYKKSDNDDVDLIAQNLKISKQTKSYGNDDGVKYCKLCIPGSKNLEGHRGRHRKKKITTFQNFLSFNSLNSNKPRKGSIIWTFENGGLYIGIINGFYDYIDNEFISISIIWIDSNMGKDQDNWYGTPTKWFLGDYWNTIGKWKNLRGSVGEAYDWFYLRDIINDNEKSIFIENHDIVNIWNKINKNFPYHLSESQVDSVIDKVKKIKNDNKDNKNIWDLL